MSRGSLHGIGLSVRSPMNVMIATVQGIREPVRVRAAYVTDEQIHTQTVD